LNGSILVDEATVSRLAGCVDEQLGAHSVQTASEGVHSNGSQSSSKTPTEEIIIQIWEDILQKKNIGVKDDFFDLGGTSLALIRIFSRVNNHFNVSLNGSVLVDEATVSRLANCVDAELQDHHQAQSQVLGRT